MFLEQSGEPDVERVVDGAGEAREVHARKHGSGECAGEGAAGLVLVEATRAQVEEGGGVELPGRRAVAALHVIGKNLKLGNEIENSYRIARIVPALVQVV